MAQWDGFDRDPPSVPGAWRACVPHAFVVLAGWQHLWIRGLWEHGQDGTCINAMTAALFWLFLHCRSSIMPMSFQKKKKEANKNSCERRSEMRQVVDLVVHVAWCAYHCQCHANYLERESEPSATEFEKLALLCHVTTTHRNLNPKCSTVIDLVMSLALNQFGVNVGIAAKSVSCTSNEGHISPFLSHPFSADAVLPLC